MNNKEYLECLFNSNKPLVIYKVKNGFNVYTDLNAKIKLTSKNVKEINLMEPLAYEEAKELIENEVEGTLAIKEIELNITNITKQENPSEENSDGQITLEI